MRWPRAALLTRARACGRRSRVFLTPRRWCQDRGAIRERRWQTSPVTGESAKETVKTTARGMPGVSGVTVVTRLECLFLFCTRGCGRIERPGFPAPSDWRGREVLRKTRAKYAPRSRAYVWESAAV